MITIVGYNEDWPKKFAEIQVCLLDLLVEEDPDLEVEHIGSTAVEGLVGQADLGPSCRGLRRITQGVRDYGTRAPGVYP